MNYFLYLPIGKEHIHIGKSVEGRCFELNNALFKGRDITNLVMLYRCIFNLRGIIKDARGTELTPSKLYGIITVRRCNSPLICGDSIEGPNGLRRRRIGYKFRQSECIAHGEGTWDVFQGEWL